MRESFLSPSHFILPLFVHEEGDQNVPISSMPGVYRLAYGKNVADAVAEARSYGVNQVVIFPKVCGFSYHLPCIGLGIGAWVACQPKPMHACACWATAFFTRCYLFKWDRKM